MTQDLHQRAVEFHDLAAHARRVAAAHLRKGDAGNSTRTYQARDGTLRQSPSGLTASPAEIRNVG
jgi:hypothetical protein